MQNRLEQTLNSARQIFAVAVDAVKEVSDHAKTDKDLQAKLEGYKLTLGRYHGILIQDIKAGQGAEVTSAFLDSLVSEHKNELI